MVAASVLAAAALPSTMLPTARGARAAETAAHYSADSAQSHLDFGGMQAGAGFKGTFHKFTALVEFAPDALAASSFEVDVDLASLDTKDNDRDTTMRGADVFDVAHFPKAHYSAHRFTKTAAGYSALGQLTLHGVTRDVPVNFQFAAAAQAKLEGSAMVKRLDFGVGQGDWKNTEWIADAVKVSFSLALRPN